MAQVRHLSPFRYPGGKTWLVPTLTQWVAALPYCPSVFVEPFAGGASCGLAVAEAKLAERVVLGEIDPEVASVWQLIFQGTDDEFEMVCERLISFQMTRDEVERVLSSPTRSISDLCFRTILKNRTQHGGVLVPSAGRLREGESGRGLSSRWYPETLCRRLVALRRLRDRVTFVYQDALSTIEEHSRDSRAVFFIDPPYTASVKGAGARLYRYSDVDHQRLFEALADVEGAVMMTYDDESVVREMAEGAGFVIDTVPMFTKHHVVKNELFISKGRSLASELVAA